MKLTVRPLTPQRWPHLEAVFNARGCSVARRCWCTYYRGSGSRDAGSAWSVSPRANRMELKRLVDAGKPPGLIAYPVDKPGRASDDAMWFGAKSMYDRAGFREVARRKPERPIVRLESES